MYGVVDKAAGFKVEPGTVFTFKIEITQPGGVVKLGGDIGGGYAGGSLSAGEDTRRFKDEDLAFRTYVAE